MVWRVFLNEFSEFASEKMKTIIECLTFKKPSITQVVDSQALQNLATTDADLFVLEYVTIVEVLIACNVPNDDILRTQAIINTDEGSAGDESQCMNRLPVAHKLRTLLKHQTMTPGFTVYDFDVAVPTLDCVAGMAIGIAAQADKHYRYFCNGFV